MIRRMLFFLSFAFALCLSGCGKASASIGIIGGADGPTAIMVSSGVVWLRVCGLVILIVAALAALILYFKKK